MNLFDLTCQHLDQQNQKSSESEIKFAWLVDIDYMLEGALFCVQSNIDVVTIKLLEYFRLHPGRGQVQSHYVSNGNLGSTLSSPSGRILTAMSLVKF